MGAEDTEMLARILAGKISALPAEFIAEIEAFIENLSQRVHGKAETHALTDWAAAASAPAFAKVWNNPEDDAYDAL